VKEYRGRPRRAGSLIQRSPDVPALAHRTHATKPHRVLRQTDEPVNIRGRQHVGLHLNGVTGNRKRYTIAGHRRTEDHFFRLWHQAQMDSGGAEDGNAYLTPAAIRSRSKGGAGDVNIAQNDRQPWREAGARRRRCRQSVPPLRTIYDRGRSRRRCARFRASSTSSR
jgi:hypothetical protein